MFVSTSFGGMIMVNSRTRKRFVPLAAVGAVALGTAGLWAVLAGSAGPATPNRSLTAAGAAASAVAGPGAGQPTARVTHGPASPRSTAAKSAGPAASTKPGPPLTGPFTLWASSPQANPCAAQAAAPDIHAGAPVTVHSVAGATVASTVLTAGRSDATHRGCVYRFTVTPLPADLSFSVIVGKRSGLVYTPEQVAATNGRITLNLGLPG